MKFEKLESPSEVKLKKNLHVNAIVAEAASNLVSKSPMALNTRSSSTDVGGTTSRARWICCIRVVSSPFATNRNPGVAVWLPCAVQIFLHSCSCRDRLSSTAAVLAVAVGRRARCLDERCCVLCGGNTRESCVNSSQWQALQTSFSFASRNNA